jgi:membrane protease subunit HflK
MTTESPDMPVSPETGEAPETAGAPEQPAQPQPGRRFGFTGGDFRAAFQGIPWRRIAWLALALAVVVYIASGIYVVNPGEVAVVRRFGAITQARVTEGLHYRFPWPIDRTDVVSVSEVRRESIGVTAADAEESKLEALSGDTNIIDFEVIIQYQVKDPAAFLFNLNYPPTRLVRDVVREVVTRQAAKTSVDDILTTERIALQDVIRTEAQAQLDTYGSGLTVVNINLQKAFPPEKVADAFTDVASAREDKSKAINQAQGYANSLLPETRGKAQEILSQAQSYFQATVDTADGKAQAFESILAEVQVNSLIYGEDVTRYQFYLETMKKIIPRVTLYMVDTERGNVRLRLQQP